MAKQSRATAQRPPSVLALERLAKLAAAGTAAPRLVATADLIVSGWRKDGMPPDELRETIATILTDLDSGVTAAEDYVSEAEGDKQRAAAQTQLDALKAAQAWFADELDRAAT